MNINCTVLIALAALIFVIGSNVASKTVCKLPEAPVSSENFKEMQYYYDSADKKIIIYFWDGSSAFIYTGLSMNIVRENEYSTYEFSILATIGDAKKDERFLKCKDGGWMISFEGINFKINQDKVIYHAAPSKDLELKFSGDLNDAVARQTRK